MSRFLTVTSGPHGIVVQVSRHGQKPRAAQGRKMLSYERTYRNPTDRTLIRLNRLIEADKHRYVELNEVGLAVVLAFPPRARFNRCACFEHAGDNDRCPVHGKAAA